MLFTTSDLCSRCRRRELGTGVLVVSWHFPGDQFFLVLADIAGQYYVYPFVIFIIKFAHYIWQVKLVMIYLHIFSLLKSDLCIYWSLCFLLAATGYTEYYFDDQTGKVCRWRSMLLVGVFPQLTSYEYKILWMFIDCNVYTSCRHIEHWNVPKMALLKQIFKPSRNAWGRSS